MEDYYSQCEAGVITKLRSLTTIFEKPLQVSTDLEDLKRGVKYFAHVFPSTFQPTRVDGKESFVRWTILFDFYVRYSTQKEALSLFKAGRKELFLLNADPNLSRTPNVFNVVLSATSELLQDMPGDNPNFLIQTFSAAVSQRIRFVP